MRHRGVASEKLYLGLIFDGREIQFNKSSTNATSLN